MLLKAILISLLSSTLSHSVTEFKYKFCDNSSKNKMIDKLFQTPNTIYVIRSSLVYPIIRREMPLINDSTEFWVQKRDAFQLRDLFLGIIR